MVLIQNSSADRLGLNPVGLTKWKKHFASVWLGRSLLCISFGKKCFGLEWCSCEFGCPSRRETLDNYSGYQLKTEQPMNFVTSSTWRTRSLGSILVT